MEFEQIYSTYFKAVYLYVLQLAGDTHIAEEITSETFFKAINSIEHFRGDCEMRVWLCQIAKNTYYSYLKKHKNTVPADDAAVQNIPDPTAPVEVHLSDQDDARLIRQILHGIAEPYKEVFMWRVYGELSFREIGNLYGKTENWACVTYHRARKMIQSRLEGIEHEK